MSRYVAILILAAVTIVGCSDSAGPGGAESLDDYWIEGYYCSFPDVARELVWRSCSVYVRSGGPDGEPVPGLNVTCNGQSLPFVNPSYSTAVTGVEPGGNVTFEVSDGRSLVTLTLEVPDAPAGLTLVEEAWDFSSPLGSHTLTWTNPDVTADSVFVSIASRGTHPLDVHGYGERLPAIASEMTLNNADLVGFAGAVEVSCCVAQGVSGTFAGHAGGSEMWARAAVVRGWGR